MTWKQALFVVWLITGVYGFVGLNRGWVPHDEGQFYQTASRTLSGEMPHRDFDEMYTGGLTYLHAFALRWFGDRMISLRVVLFIAYLLWIPAVFYVASQFGTPAFAAAVSVLAAVWSVPNYSASVPSWYNLFLAVFGVAATIRYLDTLRRRWIFAAGVCGGLSFIVKLVGLYYVAGIVLFLLLCEQSGAWDCHRGRSARSPIYSSIIAAGLVAFLCVIIAMVRPGFSVSSWLMFVVPSGAIAVTLLLREIEVPPGSFTSRALSLGKMLIPFMVGVAIPIGFYLFVFAIAGGGTELFRALFVASQRRLEFASYPAPQFGVLICGPMMLVMLVMWRLSPSRPNGTLVTIISTWLAILFVYSAYRPVFYQLAWRPLVFMLALLTVSTVLPLGRKGLLTLRQQKAVLLSSVSAMCALVQFPFPAAVYFCYVAPLVILSFAATPIAAGRQAQWIATALMAFYMLFAVFRVTPGFIYYMGARYSPDRLTAEMKMPPARGIRVFPEEAHRYERVVELISEMSQNHPIYAFPDAPEIYALSGYANPTRTIYEFLAHPSISDDTVLNILTRQDVRVVVLNRAPKFSGEPSKQLLEDLRQRYPKGEMVDNFEVRWRD